MMKIRIFAYLKYVTPSTVKYRVGNYIAFSPLQDATKCKVT